MHLNRLSTQSAVADAEDPRSTAHLQAQRQLLTIAFDVTAPPAPGRRATYGQMSVTPPAQDARYFFSGGSSTPSTTCTMPFPARTEPTIFASFTYVCPSFTWNTTFCPFATPSFMPSFIMRVS